MSLFLRWQISLVLFGIAGGFNIGLWVADRLPDPNPGYGPLVIGVILVGFGVALAISIAMQEAEKRQ